jgi:hypothetical protein
MILSVAAIMHDHEPHAVRRYSKFLSARIFREGISFAIVGGRSSAAPEHEVNQNCAAVNKTARAIFSRTFGRGHAQGHLRSLTVCNSCRDMVSGIHVCRSAGDIPGEIAYEAHGDCANILDGDEPPHRRSLTSLVN